MNHYPVRLLAARKAPAPLVCCVMGWFAILICCATPLEASDGLDGKLVVGYQGWFGCPNDFEANKAWQHWFLRGVRSEFMTVDLLPSVGQIDSKDLCETGIPRADGQGTIKLFSSQNPKIVFAHFRWMRDAEIDGAATQRFVSEIGDPVKRRRSDHVLTNVRAASEGNNRVFFVVFDVSGEKAESVVSDVRQDWRHLVNDLKLTDSPAYMRDHGKPVLELWGFGFRTRVGAPEEVGALIRDLKTGQDGLAAVTLIGGVPARWRTLEVDAKPEAGWAKVYRSYDVISPWWVGRFNDEVSATAFTRDVVVPDLAEARRAGVRYMPVIFPGFSAYNQQLNHGNLHDAVLDRIPRRCGKFLWWQVSSLLSQHVDMLYAAMFDEADEGTALFPMETQPDKLPAGSHMVYLNQDGCSLPEDWYLRVVGRAAQYIHRGETPPVKLSDVVSP